MKHIGFIDYYLDEWHANHYPEWIRTSAAKLGIDADVTYAWADMDKPGGRDTASWCRDYNIKPVETIEKLVELSDYIIVLSPDNPEHHERLSKLPLMSGKRVYVDKTFSPDLASGVRMFETAKSFGTPMFSSSALRFSKELGSYPDEKVNRGTLEFVATSGPGHFENYSVHQLEMIVALMGTGAKKVKSLSSNNGKLLVIEYEDGRRGSMLQMAQTPFQVSMELKDGSSVFVPNCSDTFPRFIDAMMTFFETGKSPVPSEETLEIMALIEAGYKAIDNYDTWIDVPRP